MPDWAALTRGVVGGGRGDLSGSTCPLSPWKPCSLFSAVWASAHSTNTPEENRDFHHFTLSCSFYQEVCD